MIKRSALNEFGDYAVWVGILLMAASLPLSLFGLSLGQFIIIGGWILGGNLKNKIKQAFSQPAFWILTGVYFWVIFGLWNTTNTHFALDSLRIKIPLLLMPFFFSSIQKFTLRQYRIVLAFLVAATFISTVISFIIYLGWTKVQVHNIRDIVVFLSHIRLALLVCFSIIVCLWFINDFKKYQHKFYLFLLIGWFIFFIVLLESLTGLFILSALGLLYIIYKLFKNDTSIYFRLISMAIIVLVFVFSNKLYQYVFVDSIKIVKIDFNKIPKKTKYGNFYVTDTTRQDTENGTLVWLNVCEIEMDSVWHLRTEKTIYDKDITGYEIKYALSRFLASKNLTCDAEGVNRLTIEDISAIQKGVSNINDLHGNMISKRIRELAWEYRIYYFSKNPSAHSFTMRLEFWKVGWFILKNNFIAGVGTGDLQDEYNKAYEDFGSKLDTKWRLACHNEYLRIAVLYGLPGLIYFIFSLFYPFLRLNKKQDILYSSFLFIALCSMLTEDTLETQTGVTFFAFLNAFLLFHWQDKKNPCVD